MLRLLRDNNNGTVMVITLALVTLLAILSAAFASIATFGMRNANWHTRRAQSFYITEAGLDKAIALLRQDSDWSASGCGDGSATNNFSGEGGWYPLHDPNTGTNVNNITIGSDTYSVSVQLCNPPGSNGKKIDIKAEGDSQNVKRKIQMRAIGLSLAVFGDEGVDMAGHPAIDSYNSNNGPYGGTNIGANGNVGSNKDIELKGNTTLSGDVTPGPGCQVLITSGSVTVTGSTEPAKELIYLPPVDINFSATNGLAKHGNQTYTLTDGTYYFTNIDFSANSELVINGNVTIYCESATFSGQAQITVNGKLKFYCSGDFKSTGGGIINATQKAENFILYSSGALVDIKLVGNSSFYGVIYAPNADADVSGTNDFYGSVIARTVTCSGTGLVHYDEALDNVIKIITTALWHEVY